MSAALRRVVEALFFLHKTFVFPLDVLWKEVEEERWGPGSELY